MFFGICSTFATAVPAVQANLFAPHVFNLLVTIFEWKTCIWYVFFSN